MTGAPQASLEAATRAEPEPPAHAEWVPPPTAPPKPRAVTNKWLPVEETPPEPETSVAEHPPVLPSQPPATEWRSQEAPTRSFVTPEESNGAPIAEVGEPEPVGRGPVPGEPRATSGPTSRQRAAVEAYCRELCPRDTASAVAAEALASVADMNDVELLRHTRSAAARYAAKPSRHGWRRVLPSGRDGGCASTPALLAARANDELPPPGHGALERHLDSCVICQAADLRMRRAERAFAGITGTELTAEPALGSGATVTAPEAAPPPPEEVPTAPEPTPTPREEIPTARDAAPTAPTAKWTPPAVVEQRARARAEHEGTTAGGAPPPAAVISPAEARPPHRRLSSAMVAAGAGAVAAAAIAAALLLSTGSSKHNTVARATTPAAPVTTAVATPHKAQPAAKKPAKKPAPHPAASPAPAATPAGASAAPASSSSGSQSAASSSSSASSPSASSSPPASSSAPSSPRASSPAPSSPPSVSIQQPSLGSANAPQGVGK
jgi:WAS/WASL-interacting protein